MGSAIISKQADLDAFCARLRTGVETAGAHLTERFAVACIRVHDLWHFQHRLIRKVLVHTVGVFLNLHLGRPLLDLDGLVTVQRRKEWHIRFLLTFSLEEKKVYRSGWTKRYKRMRILSR